MSDKPPSIPSPQEVEAARRRHRIAQKERMRQITRLNVARKLLYAMAQGNPRFSSDQPEWLVSHAFKVADRWLAESHFLEIWEKDHEEAEEAERNGAAQPSLLDVLAFGRGPHKKEN